MTTTLTTQQLFTGFYEDSAPEEFIPSQKLKAWDKKPFFNDSWIFNSGHNDPETALESKFDNIVSGVHQKRHASKFYKNVVLILTACITPKYIKEIMGAVKSSLYTTCEPKRHDNFFDWVIDSEFDRVKQEKFTSEVSQEEKNSIRLDGNQLDRMILEDCTYDKGVKILQPINTKSCSIPSHLKIENIAKYMNISYADAGKLARIYNIIFGAGGYKALTQRPIRSKIDKFCRKSKNGKRVSLAVYLGRWAKTTGKKPWEAPVCPGMTLEDLADEFEKMANADQEAPDWMHYDDGIFKFKILDDLAVNEYEYLDTEPDTSFEITNQLGKEGFTYWNDSVITKAEHLLSKKTNKLFIKIVKAIANKKVKVKNLNKLRKYTSKLTKSQQAEVQRTIFRHYREVA